MLKEAVYQCFLPLPSRPAAEAIYLAKVVVIDLKLKSPASTGKLKGRSAFVIDNIHIESERNFLRTRLGVGDEAKDLQKIFRTHHDRQKARSDVHATTVLTVVFNGAMHPRKNAPFHSSDDALSRSVFSHRLLLAIQ